MNFINIFCLISFICVKLLQKDIMTTCQWNIEVTKHPDSVKLIHTLLNQDLAIKLMDTPGYVFTNFLFN